ncbi:MAG TPA: hypothetical protein VEQ85_03995 [Lacipirellulaceae bacterium]|nr:hypothetical protein [Lacipirellulaceae bacterium]
MMDWRPSIEQLARAQQWTYRASRQSMAEPAAWAAIALASHGELDAARRPAAWLASIAQADGSVGVSAAEHEPRWPTSLATLAWAIVDSAAAHPKFTAPRERAVAWSLADAGNPAPRSPKIGHDTTLVGWPWAANTASWLEPTCMHVLGLAAAGYADHPRVQEGRRLVLDRLLPGGGANYGNTVVLGQQLVAHVAPTGIALAALGGTHADDPRVQKSLDYLEKALGLNSVTGPHSEAGPNRAAASQTGGSQQIAPGQHGAACPHAAPMSLSWALIGLTAYGRRPAEADALIRHSLHAEAWQPLAPFELALLLVAAEPRALLLGAPHSGGRQDHRGSHGAIPLSPSAEHAPATTSARARTCEHAPC